MSALTPVFGTPVNITSTSNVTTTVNTVLLGFYVNSTSAGTLVLRAGGSGGTVLTGTITPAIGFHPFPSSVKGGLHATIASTLNVTFFVVAGIA